MTFAAGLLQLAIAVIAIGVILQLIKPEDALKQITSLLAAVAILVFAVGWLNAVWHAMSFWQRAFVVLIAIGVGAIATRKSS